jgi:hypothetical protein
MRQIPPHLEASCVRHLFGIGGKLRKFKDRTDLDDTAVLRRTTLRPLHGLLLGSSFDDPVAADDVLGFNAWSVRDDGFSVTYSYREIIFQSAKERQSPNRRRPWKAD